MTIFGEKNHVKARYRFAVVAIVVALFAAAATCATFGRTAATGEEQWDHALDAIGNHYSYGDTITLPEGGVTVDGKHYAAARSLIFPGGRATSNATVTLDEFGVYRVVYAAVTNGQRREKTFEFTVNMPLFRVGAKGDAEYGTWFEGEAQKEGIMVSLPKGETFELMQVLDVGSITKDDMLLELIAAPSGSLEFFGYEVTFTDVEDPSVYMTVTAHQPSSTEITTYVSAAGNGQVRAGMEQGGRIHKAPDPYGTWIAHRFDIINGTLPIRYDSGECALYTWSEEPANRPYNLVADFDNPDFFDAMWNGFPSGKVRVSIKAKDYVAGTARFIVLQAYGVDLTAEDVIDEDAPRLDIDLDDKYLSAMPEGRLGERYPVPAATAFDIYSGYCDVRTDVYYCYGMANQISVEHSDGYVDTKRYGSYAIVYTASDIMGNEVERAINFHVGGSIDDMTVTVDSASAEKDAPLGKPVAVPLPTALVGGSGNEPTYKITARLQSDSSVTYDATSGSFIPQKGGKYDIIYTAIDFTGHEEEFNEYQVVASYGGKPLFPALTGLPKYFISGGEYTLPECYAVDYANGEPEQKLASATVSYGTQTVNVAAGGKFTPVVDTTGEIVTVKFTAGNAEEAVEVPTVLPIEYSNNRNRLRIKNYFMGDGFNTNPTPDYIEVEATAADGGFEFANPIIASDATLAFLSDEDNSEFDAIVLRFTDSVDHSRMLEARIINNKGGNASFEVGGKNYPLSYGFDGTRFDVTVTGGALKVGDVGGAIGNADLFPSGKFYVYVGFENATPDSAAIRMTELDHQPMTNITQDFIRPRIAMLGNYGGMYGYGKTITLAKAIASDALAPNVTFTMSVTRPDKTEATDLAGVPLTNVDPTAEHRLKLDQYGMYSVTLSAVDTYYPTPIVLTYTIIVMDTEAPTVQFGSSVPTTARVGDVLHVPQIIAADNLTAAENLVIIRQLALPDGRLMWLSGDDAIRFTTAGTYELFVSVMDEAGNTTFRKLVISVEK